MSLSYIDNYTPASPRYNVCSEPTFVQDTDAAFSNILFDKLNGTYDKFWGLYAITDSKKPTTFVVYPDNTETALKGDISYFQYRNDVRKRILGKYDNPNALLANSNLVQETLKYDEYKILQLNPGWCTIQNSGTTPTLIIRCLGDTSLTKTIFSSKLPAYNSLTPFPVGMLATVTVTLKDPIKNTTTTVDKLYRCIVSTLNYPSDNDSSWTPLSDIRNNVFIADLFNFFGSQTSYTLTVVDNKRFFSPTEDLNLDSGGNSTLVSYNVSYWN